MRQFAASPTENQFCRISTFMSLGVSHIRAFIATLLLTLAGCDGAPPDYIVDNTLLRLIPETSTVSPDAGQVFVLLELTTTSTDQIQIALQAMGGAILAPLPGDTACARDGGSSSVDGGQTSMMNPTTLVIPTRLLENDPKRMLKKTGIVLNYPAGDQDVLLVGSALADTADAGECNTDEGSLLAFTSVRISRIKPDASTPPDQSVPDGGVADAAIPDLGAAD